MGGASAVRRKWRVSLHFTLHLLLLVYTGTACVYTLHVLAFPLAETYAEGDTDLCHTEISLLISVGRIQQYVFCYNACLCFNSFGEPNQS